MIGLAHKAARDDARGPDELGDAEVHRRWARRGCKRCAASPCRSPPGPPRPRSSSSRNSKSNVNSTQTPTQFRRLFNSNVKLKIKRQALLHTSSHVLLQANQTPTSNSNVDRNANYHRLRGCVLCTRLLFTVDFTVDFTLGHCKILHVLQ